MQKLITQIIMADMILDLFILLAIIACGASVGHMVGQHEAPPT